MRVEGSDLGIEGSRVFGGALALEMARAFGGCFASPRGACGAITNGLAIQPRFKALVSS